MPIYSHCVTCAHPLRTDRYANPDEPDAVPHHARGECKPCYRRRARSQKQVTQRICLKCERPMVPKKGPEPEPGQVRSESRGLCNACYLRTARAGTLDQYEPLNGRGGKPGRPIVRHLAEDFHFLVESIGGTRAPTALGWDARTRRTVAARLNCTTDALDAALYRELRKAA